MGAHALQLDPTQRSVESRDSEAGLRLEDRGAGRSSAGRRRPVPGVSCWAELTRAAGRELAVPWTDWSR
jgi:hypothetical protein